MEATAVHHLLRSLGVPHAALSGGDLPARSPIDGQRIAAVHTTAVADVPGLVETARRAFDNWRRVPAPRRGELVRLLGDELRASKEALGRIVTLETGKILQEGLGEVQEMIDICDFAVGLSRQLYGLTMPSERPSHRMAETWHPYGPCAVITAFNFPVAVWSWNAALALVCGDPVIWKPSEKTPLTALAVQAVFERAGARFGDAPAGLNQLAIGTRELGAALAAHAHLPLISATGSTRMGRAVAAAAAPRFARTILELGGNNASIVCPSADPHLVQRAVVFAAAGTTGQRCTSLRRLFVHESIYPGMVEGIQSVFRQIRVGNPFDANAMVGPLIDEDAFARMQHALAAARQQGGAVTGGERVEAGFSPDAYYVRPALVEMPQQTATVREETFAPILYVMRYRDLPDAIAAHNDTPYGLSSSIFTNDLREMETFLSALGSDCGIANVNMGPSGAEIGGAFGGEKATGGGREAGSDAWKAYMRRATHTINYGDALPLAQGIRFDV